MIVKFSKHGKGKACGVLDYLLREKSKDGSVVPRKHAKILYGDPVLTEHLIDTTRYKSKYKSGYLSFSERADEISEADKRRIMQEFEEVIFCGLEKDQYDILWVEHADKDIDANNPVGRLKLNFIIPCQELRTGKSFQPYYAPADQRRVNAWKNIVNAETKTVTGSALTDPNDPKRKRMVNPHSSNAPRPNSFNIRSYTRKKAVEDGEIIRNPTSRLALEEALKRRLLLEYQRGMVTKRQSLLSTLTSWGLGIKRGNSEKSVSVTHDRLRNKNGQVMSVRLKGGMFEKDFNGVKFQPYIKELDSRAHQSERNKYYRERLDKTNLKEGMKIKFEYHKQRYKDAVIPKLLMLDKVNAIADIVESPKIITQNVEPPDSFTPFFRY